MVEAMAWFYVGAMEAAEALDTLVLVGDFGVAGQKMNTCRCSRRC